METITAEAKTLPLDELKIVAYRLISNNIIRDKAKRQRMETAKRIYVYLAVSDIARLTYEIQKAMINQNRTVQLVTVNFKGGYDVAEVSISELMFMAEELIKFSNVIDSDASKNMNRIRFAKDTQTVLAIMDQIQQRSNEMELTYQKTLS